MIKELLLLAMLWPPATDLADVPVPLRQRNHLHNGEGSCVHVTQITLLYYHGLDKQAEAWQKAYPGGGEYKSTWLAKLKTSGLKYAYTDVGDLKFLEWACRNRMAPGIFINDGRHCVNLVDLTDTHAVILDNNFPTKFRKPTRQAFLSDWLSSGGFAWTLVYPPPPPWPQ